MNWQQQWQYLIEQLYFDFITFFEPKWENVVDFSRPPIFMNLPKSVVEHHANAAQQSLVIGVRQKNDTPSILLFVLETKGYDNQEFAQKVFNDFVATISEFHHKIPVNLLTLFLANSLPKDAERYEYRVGSTHLQLHFNHYIVREQYLEDLLDMVNPFAFVIAVCRLRLEHENAPKLMLENKLLLIKRLMQRFLKKRIQLQTVLVLLYFIKHALDLPKDWEAEFIALAKIEVQLSNAVTEQYKTLLINAIG